MKTLRDSGVVPHTIKEGIKILSDGHEAFTAKINIEVSQVSGKAADVIEANGGKVTARLVVYI